MTDVHKLQSNGGGLATCIRPVFISTEYKRRCLKNEEYISRLNVLPIKQSVQFYHAACVVTNNPKRSRYKR